MDASETAQKSRREGRLREAQQLLVQCAQESCPDLVREDCAKWLGEVDESVPSIVISVRDAAGADVVSARTEIDGVPVQAATGTAITMDPGLHTFAAVSGGQRVELQSIVRVGEKNRPITLRLDGGRDHAATVAPPIHGSSAEPRGDSAPGRRVAAFVSMGVTALATTGFLYAGLSGVAQRRELLDTCGTGCDLSERDSVRTKFLVADVSLGIAVVAAAATVWLLLTSKPTARIAAPSREQ